MERKARRDHRPSAAILRDRRTREKGLVMPAPFWTLLNTRKSKSSQRASIANMSLRRSPTSGRATSVRHDRANVHDGDHDHVRRDGRHGDRHGDRRDDRRGDLHGDRRDRDRQPLILETAEQPLPRK